MNILVVFTGGTIGSASDNKSIAPDRKKPYKLIEMYSKTNVNFITAAPYTVLSENMTCREYGILYNFLKENITENLDGIIVTHGSDTIQYSAAFFAYTMGKKLPIMLVASNYVLEDKRANGLANFTAAVDFICNSYGKGVFVPYKNSDGICYVHGGNKLLPHMTYRDDLYSIDDDIYGKYTEDTFVRNEAYMDTVQDQFGIGDILPRESNIMCLEPFPGMIYPEIPENVKAIIHGTYHSGTICTEAEGLESFAKKAAERNIPVYISGMSDGITYESCDIYKKLNFINSGRIAPAALYIKTWLELQNQ